MGPRLGILEIIILMAVSVMAFGSGLISGLIAWQKGYRPWFWLLAMGLIGTLVIVLIPDLARAKSPEERERMESRADWTGGILTGFSVLPLIILPMLGALFFMGVKTTVTTAKMPAAPAPVYTTVDQFEAPGKSLEQPSTATSTNQPTTAEQPSNTEQPANKQPTVPNQGQ